MNQILLGTSIPFAIICIWYAIKKFRASILMLIMTPFWLALGAVWAILPDIPRILGLHDLYWRMATDPRTDIFFWHYTIDKTETDSSLYHVGLLLIGILLIAAAWRELKLREAE
ncbi:MAG: hypothetical protein KAI74_00575 [Kiritimatiellae bacterium]|nr:hypothetical protein [Kiritimatiellia bacterium]